MLGKKFRGPVLEALVARLRLGTAPPRIVAVSATVPNSAVVASWLGPETVALDFDERYRSVPTTKVVKGFNNNTNPFKFDQFLTRHVGPAIEEHSNGRPALVFCATKATSPVEWP